MTLISAIGGLLLLLSLVALIITIISKCLERRATSGTYSPSKREMNSIPLPNIQYDNKPPRPPIERLI